MSLPLTGLTRTRAVRTDATLPSSDDVSNAEQDDLGIICKQSDTTSIGDETPPTTACACGSTSCGIAFEDQKPGSGPQVQGHSTVTFTTKMKDIAGTAVDRFSYELASRRRHPPQDLKLIVRSLHVHSGSVRGSFRVRPVGIISIQVP